MVKRSHKVDILDNKSMEATSVLEIMPSEKDNICRSAIGNGCDSVQTKTLEDTGLGHSCSKKKKKRKKTEKTGGTSDAFQGDASSIKNCIPEESLNNNMGVSSEIVMDKNLFNDCHDLSCTEGQGKTELEGSQKKKKKIKKKKKKKHCKSTKHTCSGFEGDASSKENCSSAEGFDRKVGVSTNSVINQQLNNGCDSAFAEAQVNVDSSQAETKRQKRKLDTSSCIPGDVSSTKNMPSKEGFGHERVDQHLLELNDGCDSAIAGYSNVGSALVETKRKKKKKKRIEDSSNCIQDDTTSMKHISNEEGLGYELGVISNRIVEQCQLELNNNRDSTKTVAQTDVGSALAEIKRKKKGDKRIQDATNCIPRDVSSTKNVSTEEGLVHELVASSNSIIDQHLLKLNNSYDSAKMEAQTNAGLAQVEMKSKKKRKKRTQDTSNCSLGDGFSMKNVSTEEGLGHELGVAKITIGDQHHSIRDSITIGQSLLVSEDRSHSLINTSKESNHNCDGNSSIALFENKATKTYKRKDKPKKCTDHLKRTAEDMVVTPKTLLETPSGKDCELLESESDRMQVEEYATKIEVQETVLEEKMDFDSSQSDIAPKESKEDVEIDNDIEDTMAGNVTQHFSVSRSVAIHPSRKLLILDINGLLADVVNGLPRGYQPNLKLPRKSVFVRPYCHDFLHFCFEKFNVGVWTSRVKINMDKIVSYLFENSIDKLLFCWDRSRCTKTRFTTVEDTSKPLVLKELKKLWENKDDKLPWRKGEFNESNTLLLDDSPYKALRNPVHNAVFPYPYDYRNHEDSSLGSQGDLRLFLEKLADAEDVKEFISQNPFGQRAITESNASWGFYSKIISLKS